MISKEAAYNKISELVERFGEQFDSYKKADYNETLTRRDFIDPFFKALGWDIDNEEGYAEAYREVIHEDKVKIGSATKAPDYSFRLVGGKRLFFVEAKKPSIAIKDDILPAYQVRRYGWSAKLSISIITDFEEFAIYDCTKKPIPTDKASVARVKYITYKDYLKEFDFIWDTFSKERVLKGSFDKFIQGTANKKGTATVDKEFLQSLDSWRTYLATSISWNNKDLDEDEINFAVQQTIDRIIFLRIAEDRSVEPYGNLKIALMQGDYYQNLFGIFKEADDKYNSGLFNFKKDRISKNLKVDNKVIKTIVTELYYPESPYEFSVLSVEILGSAYEQFLGKVIRITPAHHAKIEEKPEVRKAGGVYYTPQYIVEYIVKNTVGKLIDGKTPKEISNLKIVDPACGSGSFLIGAYQYLLDFHKDYYSENGKPGKGKKDHAYRQAGNPLTPEGNLTTAEKKRILLNNIFGVDIDVNAVEVSKLSLLLKCMEGETSASIAHQLSMFHERVLPTLENNIKDGNSLVDTDYYDSQLDFGEDKKVKPFNWKKGFPEIENFDVVIGNPPYFRVEAERPESNYLRTKYSTPEFKLDIYTLFIEKFAKEGFKKFGFIIPNTLLTNLTDRKLRKLLLEKTNIDEIVNYRIRVFQDAVVHSMILILDDNLKAKKVKITEVNPDSTEVFEIEKKKFLENENYSFDIRMFGKNASLFENLNSKSIKLSKLCEVKQAIKTGNDQKYISNKKERANFKKVIGGSEMQRYQLNYDGRYVDYGDYLACPRNPHIFEVSEKILIRETGKRITATFDDDQYYIMSSLYSVFLKDGINYNLKYILGVINSNLSQFFMKQLCFDNSSGAFIKARIFHYQQLPIKIINFKTTEKDKHDEIVKLVDQLLKLNEEKAEEKLQTKISQLDSKIDYCENRINEIVYKLYDLTEEEIKIVEGK
ncbi:MAG: TaqI-like C-terminal specificity domain-containing protein [Bacteroidota bacterium]